MTLPPRRRAPPGAPAVPGKRPTTRPPAVRDRPVVFGVAGSSLGAVLLAHGAEGVCALLLGDDPDRLALDLRARFPRAEPVTGDRGTDDLLARAVALVDHPWRSLPLPLAPEGTDFQRQVWRALQAIPPGSTRTYADLARVLGRPGATRAVGSACAANPVAVAIPCHRVVRSDGGPSGYRWGAARKTALLERERGGIGLGPARLSPTIDTIKEALQLGALDAPAGSPGADRGRGSPYSR